MPGSLLFPSPSLLMPLPLFLLQGSPSFAQPPLRLLCSLPRPLTLCILVLPGYAITVHNGTFTWAQDLPPALHRYH